MVLSTMVSSLILGNIQLNVYKSGLKFSRDAPIVKSQLRGPKWHQVHLLKIY